MKHTQTAHFDNIATASHPVWRKRERQPFTCRAVREQIIAEATAKPEHERLGYIAERLTDLDKALDCGEADAIEHWLDCEEMLHGRAKTVDWSGGGGGSGRDSQIPDDAMEALAEHDWRKWELDERDRIALTWLESMMHARKWFMSPKQIVRTCRAARALTKMHR